MATRAATASTGAEGSGAASAASTAAPPAGLAALLIRHSGRGSVSETKAIVDQYATAEGVALDGVNLLVRAAMMGDLELAGRLLQSRQQGKGPLSKK